MLFYLIAKRISVNYKPEVFRSEPDFGLLIKKLLDRKDSPKIVKRRILGHLEGELQKKISNKKRSIPLNTAMDSFISFFRLGYLAYFGFYIISSDLRIEGLIVGLLFITILIRPIISLIKSIPMYYVCKNSFFKINSLLRP